jgi:thymidylate kinase
VFSALAYRCAEDPSIKGYVQAVNSIFPTPDLAILIDISADESLARGRPIGKNNYAHEYLSRVRAEYLALAAEHSIVVLDGSRPYDMTREDVTQRVNGAL